MDLLEIIQNTLKSPEPGPAPLSFSSIEKELAAGLRWYWEIAETILEGSGVRLRPPSPDYFALNRNFFSLLFLYSYHRAGLPPDRRIFYAAINQCLRGMVTGCDNLLDDEYKKTLSTDLPEKGWRMRSVIDIMVSDRVLYALLMDACRKNELTLDQVASAGAVSLQALTQSGAQEAQEEGGIDARLTPEEVLSRVHHYKTALLFQCVWAIPEGIESSPPALVSMLKQALYEIGMGCQILDDMVDLSSDIRNRRHNYAASLIHHASAEAEGLRPEMALLTDAELEKETDLLMAFPAARKAAAQTAIGFLEKGLRALFIAEHRALIQPAIYFIARQIGADRFFPDAPE
ncbi:MAG: class 1 isoprenoid biosynthesis enzyme [Pseudomonadota bacterium]